MYILKGAKIHTSSDLGVIEKGMIRIEGSKIIEIGESVNINDNIPVIDVTGLEICPGFIEPHSTEGCRMFMYGPLDRLETSRGMLHPELNVLDVYNEQQIGVQLCLDNGLTTMCVVPYGKINTTRVVNGTGAIVKTTPTNFVIKENACLRVAFGMMPIATEALGVRYKGINNLYNRLTSLISLLLWKKFKRSMGKPRKQFKKLLNNYDKIGYKGENVSKALSKEMFTYITTDHADDIKAAIQLSEQYGLKLVLLGLDEVLKVKQLIKEKHIPCVMRGYGGAYTSDLDEVKKTVSLIEDGVLICLTTTHPQINLAGWKLPYSAAILVRMGISHEEALKTITINSAKVLGIDDRTGSLEVGKDADLVIFNGDPLEAMSQIKGVICNGKVYNSKIQGLMKLRGEAK